MSFRITGLPAEDFSHLFSLDDAELAALGAVRRTAQHGAPCRISLTDATPGDEVILANYEHHKVDSPYRMRFAIYVRKGEETYDKVDEVPEQLRKRTLAARAFDAGRHDGRLRTGRGRRSSKARSSACSPSRAPPTCTSISRRPAAMRRAWNGPELETAPRSPAIY